MIHDWYIFNRVSQERCAEGTATTLEAAEAACEEAAKADFGTRRLDLVVEPQDGTERFWQKHPLHGWEALA